MEASPQDHNVTNKPTPAAAGKKTARNFTGALKRLHAAHAIRSLTATALMVVGALVPFTLVHGFAAPPPDHIGRATIAEVASLTQEDLLEGLGTAGRPQEKTRRSRALAKDLLTQAAAVEGAVTRDMQRLEGENAKLLGLDHRMKSEDSLARKIETDAEKKHLSPETAASGIHDVLRYTLAIDADRYQETVPCVLRRLEEKGYEVQKFNNAWGGKYYQGVNVQLKTPGGIPIELQFHTPQSFAIKQASHGVYEIRRDPAATAEEKARATRLSIAYNVQVKAPEGAEALAWPAA